MSDRDEKLYEEVVKQCGVSKIPSHVHDTIYGRGPKLKMFVRSPELRPSRANPTDSGLDLRADVQSMIAKWDESKSEVSALYGNLPKPWTMFDHGQLKVRTGVYVSVPPGYEIQVRPRSGLASKYSITITNAPGTIDCSYRGEIQVLLFNLGSPLVRIEHGDRIAQIVMTKVELGAPEFVDSVESLGITDRGASGFGSTGVS